MHPLVQMHPKSLFALIFIPEGLKIWNPNFMTFTYLWGCTYSPITNNVTQIFWGIFNNLHYCHWGCVSAYKCSFVHQFWSKKIMIFSRFWWQHIWKNFHVPKHMLCQFTMPDWFASRLFHSYMRQQWKQSYMSCSKPSLRHHKYPWEGVLRK